MNDKQLTPEEEASLYDQSFPRLTNAWKQLVSAKNEAGWKDFHYMVLKLDQNNPTSYKIKSTVDDKTAALQARVVELERIIEGDDKVIHEYINVRSENADLKSRIAELQREVRVMEEGMEKEHDLINQLDKAEQHAEKLMGLLEIKFKAERKRFYDNGLMVVPMVGMKERLESDWQSYCKENGLNQG